MQNSPKDSACQQDVLYSSVAALVGCVTTGCSSIPATRPPKTAYDGANINQKANPVKFPWPIQEIWCLRLSVLLLLALKGYTHPGGQANDGHYGHRDPRGKQQAVFTTQVFCWSNGLAGLALNLSFRRSLTCQASIFKFHLLKCY